jgi:hypothetical protein
MRTFAENNELNILAQSRNQAFIRLTENLTDFKVSWICGGKEWKKTKLFLSLTFKLASGRIKEIS